MSSIKKLAIRGAFWTIAGYGASLMLRFGSNLILTRLLEPKLFGFIALVYVFITGLHLFSDIGIGLSVIQNKRGDEPDFLNTAWTLQVVRGFGLWFCCFLIAWPVANFYEKPSLIWLIPLVGLNTLISGFNSTAIYTLNRHIALRQVAMFELGGQIISTGVTILWAWFNPTIWALVVGSLFGTCIQLVWSHLLNSGTPNRFVWEKTAVDELFLFGKWIFLSTAIAFLAEKADRMILGKLFTLEMLGVYGIALTLGDLPRSVTLALAGKVIFPAISKIADQPRETIRTKLIKNRQLLLIAFAIGLTALIACGDIIIKILYDKRYIDAAWMLPLLALGIWPRILCNTNEASLFAIGKTQYTAAANLTRFVWTAVGILLGFYWMGIPGAIVAVTLNDLFYYIVVNYGLWRERLSCLIQDIQLTGLFLSLLTVVLAGRYWLGFGSPIDGLL
ncbi:MAG TPA: oligosaccharide flippase family protein [Kamptonema sp.]|nr:oligosaccharide flippase family protein [Kamptonema sp.]